MIAILKKTIEPTRLKKIQVDYICVVETLHTRIH